MSPSVQKTLTFKNTVNQGATVRCNMFARTFGRSQAGAPASRAVETKKKKERCASTGAAEAWRGRQPNPRGGHPPSKRKRLVDVWLGMSIVIRRRISKFEL